MAHHRHRKPKGRPIDGWLIIDKPTAIGSTDVVAICKRGFQAQKCGHGGTLDPLATGVLPIAFGAATKTVPYVMITCGGPMMTKDCEVRNSDGLVIEGVYMAGEIVGMANVGGRNSIGGMGHGNCLVWGKKAAEVIAAKLGK